MKDLFAFLANASEIAKVLADPERREEVKLRYAIEAAERIMMIDNREGMYKALKDKTLERKRIHWYKRWLKYKDGV